MVRPRPGIALTTIESLLETQPATSADPNQYSCCERESLKDVPGRLATRSGRRAHLNNYDNCESLKSLLRGVRLHIYKLSAQLAYVEKMHAVSRKCATTGQALWALR